MRPQLLFVFVPFLLLLSSCDNNQANSQPQVSNLTRLPALTRTLARMNCSIGDDIFSCQKQACINANGQYDQDAKVCHCSDGQIFYAREGGTCLASTINEGTLTFSPSRINSLKVQLLDFDPEDPRLGSILSTRSLIIESGADNRLLLLKSTTAYKSLLMTLPMMNGIVSVLPVKTDLELDPNAGVSNRAVDMNFIGYFLPTSKSVTTGNIELDALANSVMKSSGNFVPTKYVVYSDLGCAEICETEQTISLTEKYLVIHSKLYSGGNPIQDILKFLNLKSHHFELQISLLNQQVSHYQYRHPEKGYQLFSTNGEVISVNVFPLSLENRSFNPNSTDDQVPVAIFEPGNLNDEVDRVAAIGPYKDISYFGWFEDKDQLPYLAGKYSGDTTATAHANNVTALASDGYQKILLPMPSSSLFDGTFTKVLARVPFKHLIGNLSVVSIFADNQRSNNNLAQMLAASRDKVLWVQGAGNLGNELKHSTFEMASQSQSGLENFIVVAATDGHDELASTSSYSTHLVDIAATGCIAGNDNCDGAMAGTSYAAPRVSRIAADLMIYFPEFNPGQIKLALMLTARIPSRPLPVRSLGVVDAEAAKRFLTLLRQHGSQPIQALSMNTLEELVLSAKFTNFSNYMIKKEGLRDLVKKQIKSIFSN